MSRSSSRSPSIVLLSLPFPLLHSSSCFLSSAHSRKYDGLVSARTSVHGIGSPRLYSLVQPSLEVERAEQRCSVIWASLAALVRWKYASSLQICLRLVSAFELRALYFNRLGTEEENFLLDCHTRYGPITYLPWPLCQSPVTDRAAIQSIYNTSSKTLVFVRLSPSRLLPSLVLSLPPSLPSETT